MKKMSRTIIACLLVVLMAALAPLSVFAQSAQNTDNTGKYISEIRIGMGVDADSAAASLKGYTILSDNGANVDLNQSAGGGFASKGEKVVYLGYKTTDDETDAITDLAVMNMKGGYSVQDYEVLFDSYIKEQIEPLLDRFTAALAEYRINYSSENESNRQRAAYMHDALNKYTDDDTGKGLGDLLLNQTKYEMGDDAYNALSEATKKNTADIVTILCQANGEAVLTIENIMARAADTSDDTWVDRFAATTYEDLIEETGMFPTDAEIEVQRLYNDDAKKILAMWNDLYALLSKYAVSVELIEGFDADEAQRRLNELEKFIENFDPDSNTRLDLLNALNEQIELTEQVTEIMNAVKTAGVHDYLDSIGYGDGTMLDFFLRPMTKVGLTELYPMAASLSAGQKAGLDFVSLLELITIAMTDGADYSDEQLDGLRPVSIYEGVDRSIYEKGGVALTSEALRAKAMEQFSEERSMFSGLTIASAVLTGATFLAFVGSLFVGRYFKVEVHNLNVDINSTYKDLTTGKYSQYIEEVTETTAEWNDTIESNIEMGAEDAYLDFEETITVGDVKEAVNDYTKWNEEKAVAQARSSMCGYLKLGLGIALFIVTAYTVYAGYTDLVDYYDVEYTPIPRYMVDEKDITTYNANGEKVFIKNQTAYYKAAECNRNESDEMFGSVGTRADLNGDVGSQWVALYAVKQQAAAPILAGSLKAVVDNDDLPPEYTTGIHMFGSSSAFNMNNKMYVWNGDAPSVYVYYNVDSAAKRSAVGSLFAKGQLAIAGALGVVVGALATVLFISPRKKKKEENAA